MFDVPLGTPLTFESFLAKVHPDDLELVDRSWKKALRGEGYDVVHRAVINGNILWLHEKAELEFAEDGTLIAGFGTVQDITEHKSDEQKLRRLNRAMRAISNANQVLMRATDEAAFLQQGCRIIVEDCGYTMVWIGFALQDEAKSVKPMAYAGFDKGYIDSLKITWADTERGRGPTGAAIRTGQVQICADTLNDPRFAPWRAQALERGYVSSIVLPLVYESQAFGALNIYSKEKNPFSDVEELKLLVELASDFSHGIMLLRMRAKAKQAEEALRLSEERFSKAFNQSPAAISITCLSDGKYVDVNQTFLELFGYSRDEVIGHDSVYLNVFANPNAAKEFLEVFAKGKIIRNVEMTFKTRSGKLLPTITSVEKISINGEDHVITTFVDITRRKQAEEQLSRAKAEWEQTFDALPDLIAVIDNNHRILRVNKAMTDFLGKSTHALVGMHCYDCVHLTDTPPQLCPHSQTIQDGKEHIVNLFEERLGGNVVVSTSPLRDEAGHVFASIHVIRKTFINKNAGNES
jgi:PAS domain S-box-containing protein